MKKMTLAAFLFLLSFSSLAQNSYPPTGPVLVNGANDNSGKADFAVGVGSGGIATMSFTGNQFRVGSSDINWSTKIAADGWFQTYNQDISLYASGGTNASQAIKFFTRFNGAAGERMRIAPNGYLGIGTSTPLSDLHVLGTTGSANSSNFRVTYATGGNLTNTELLGLAHDPSLVSGNGWAGLIVSKGSASRAAVLDGHTDIVNGHLTLDPGSSPILYTGRDGTQGARYLQLIHSPSSGIASGFKAGGVLVADNYSYASPGKNDVVIKGSLSLGTPNIDSNSIINANGTIRAKKVKVEANGWPDYVFAPSFELRSLTEVESFIKENQHLPDVPSAEEVETNGLDLGAMDATLLKKVEELTLYTIDQDKRIKKQDELINDLLQRVEKLEKKN